MASASSSDHIRQLNELQALPFDQQSKAFLKAFVHEFRGSFSQVLDLAEEFRKQANGDQLDEQQAHIFLEKKGQAATIVEFRNALRQIDLNFDGKIGLVEYLLFFYKKTLKEMLEAKPDSMAMIEFMKAVEQYQQVLKDRREREEKIAHLEKVVARGGDGAARAKLELNQLKSVDPAKDGANEISALASKLKAQRALANPDADAAARQEAMFREEQRKVEEAKRQQEAEEKRKAEESRRRLADRAKAFGQ